MLQILFINITSHITHTTHAKQAIEEIDFLGIPTVRPYTIEEAGQEVIFLNLPGSII